MKTIKKHLPSFFEQIIWPLAIIAATFFMIFFILQTSKQLQAEHKKNVKRELTTVLKTTEGSLHFWKEALMADQTAIASLPIIRTIAQDKKITPLNHKMLQSIMQPSLKSHDYLEYAIYSMDRTEDENLLFLSNHVRSHYFKDLSDLLREIENNNFAIKRPPRINSDTITILTAAPIKDDSGKTIGAIVFLVDLYKKFIEATELARLGETGETYVISRKGEMLTPSRFGEIKGNISLIKHPLLSDQSRELTSNTYRYNVEGYRDYRGIPVIGAWTWDEEFKIGLITEIDKTEAYHSIEIINRLVWLMIAIVIVAMMLILLIREIWMRDKLSQMKQKEEARKELLSTVSHDLKSPLNALLMLNELQLRHLPQENLALDKSRKLLLKSKLVAENMKGMINDILDASRIEAGKFEIHPTACRGEEILKNTIEILEPNARAKSISIDEAISDNLPLIWADPDRLAQVFSNLISNAIKFTPYGGKIRVEARVQEQHLIFSIHDNGPGIDPAAQKHLFERFWKAESTKNNGTGLGLAICKQLVESHKGKIWVESKPGSGSTFSFTIPIYHS